MKTFFTAILTAVLLASCNAYAMSTPVVVATVTSAAVTAAYTDNQRKKKKKKAERIAKEQQVVPTCSELAQTVKVIHSFPFPTVFVLAPEAHEAFTRAIAESYNLKHEIREQRQYNMAGKLYAPLMVMEHPITPQMLSDMIEDHCEQVPEFFGLSD